MSPVTVEGSASRPRRRSAFREIGLDSEEERPITLQRRKRPGLKVRFRSKNDIFELDSDEWTDASSDALSDDEESTVKIAVPSALQRRRHQSDRFALVAFVIAISIFIAQLVPQGRTRMLSVGAAPGAVLDEDKALVKRQDSSDPTDYCKRWAGQSAVVKGTLYYYGGRKTLSSDQKSNTWNNDFFSIDLSKSWQRASPSMSALAQPSGPPAVSLGSLWASHESLFLYGGEFSDNPQGSPTANSLWEYNIGGKNWIEHTDPTTSEGENSEPAGEPIQRAAEGAGFSLPSLGRGWYFGGHIDFLTTEGWPIGVARIYLKSFVEYTFPGVKNTALKEQDVGDEGAWRNMTSAGVQDTKGFTNRADGVLIYVPGFGAEGLLLSLGGGTNESFTEMNTIDIFDIAGSQWYRQSTSGPTPKIRVNPCAVVAAAADGSSYNIYMFGGQNLIPYNEQIQYDDMWILSVPSFTWVEVDMKDQSVPYARAGHQCHIWDSQMVVVGGYIGTDIGCETPGVYVFNTSSLQWQNSFNSISGGDNPYSQQISQKGVEGKADGIEGSFGYTVPDALVSVIGGDKNGGATKTADNPATDGPFKTGSPVIYTVTSDPTEGASSGGSGGTTPDHRDRGTLIGAIVAGVLGFVLLLAAVYFAICAMIYRKQLKLYRQHVAMMQEQQSEKAESYRPGHGSLISPYHRGGGYSLDTSGESSSAYAHGTSSPNSSTDDLMEGYQPSFWGWNGVLLHPRRSLRIVNRDDMPVPQRDEDEHEQVQQQQ